MGFGFRAERAVLFGANAFGDAKRSGFRIGAARLTWFTAGQQSIQWIDWACEQFKTVFWSISSSELGSSDERSEDREPASPRVAEGVSTRSITTSYRHR